MGTYRCDLLNSILENGISDCSKWILLNDWDHWYNCSYAMLADEDKSGGDADYVCESVVISKSKFKILFCDMDGI